MASYEKLPSGRYRGVYRDSAGKKRYTPATDRAKDAKDDAVAAQAKAQRTAQREQGNTRARITWGDWWDLIMDGYVEESDYLAVTQDLVRAYLMPRWGEVPLNQIRQGDVKKWIEALSKGRAPVDMRNPRWKPRPLSASYVQRIASPLWISIAQAMEEGVLDASPVAGVQLPRRVRKPRAYMTTEEIPELTGEMGSAYADAVEFLLETGLRPSELTGLHHHRINRRGKVAVLTVAETYVHGLKKIRPWPKDRDAREIPLTDRALSIHDRRTAGRDMTKPCGLEHLRGQSCRSALVFLTSTGKPLTRQMLHRALVAAARAVGADPKSGYALRHGFATRLAEAGLDPFAIAEVMGHEDINLSRQYVEVTTKHRGRVLAALGQEPRKLTVVEDDERGTRGTERGTDSSSDTSAEAPKRRGRRAL
ncbi:site-specific recombinase XerD [Actinokineospora spheciospongiae]|nr:site-specific recombinase XerD [Actinokineospora spheciospongiae]